MRHNHRKPSEVHQKLDLWRIGHLDGNIGAKMENEAPILQEAVLEPCCADSVLLLREFRDGVQR